MARSLLCIHPDDTMLHDLVEVASANGARVEGAPTVRAGASTHARRPAEVVVADLDEDAEVVRSLLRWHPAPAVVTVGQPGDADLALASGASDHVEATSAPHDLHRSVDRAWRRHRAARTRRARLPADADLPELRARVGQVVALTIAARDLIGVEELPQPTARSLLDQATQVGRGAVDLATDSIDEQARGPLDLPSLVEAMRSPQDRPTVEVDVDPVEVHGWEGPVRTALYLMATHARRAPAATSRILADVEVLPWAVRLRLHDDGPEVPAEQRRALFVGGVVDPALLPVHHIGTRHGGAAWLADSDRLAGGTMCVLELPRRSQHR